MPPNTLLDMSPQDGPGFHVLEAELAQEELGQPGILLRIRRAVPGRDLKLAKLDG